MLRLLAMLLGITTAQAQIVGTLPYQLLNGQNADASQVMANYNYIISQVNANAAKAGANSNITSLSGLVVPLSPGQGGSQFYSAGTASGSANAVVVASSITPSGFALVSGRFVRYTVAATNTSSTTLSFNGTTATAINKAYAGGLTALTGGEMVAGSTVDLYYNGTVYVLIALPATPGNASVYPGTNVVANTTLTQVNCGEYLGLGTAVSGYTITLPTPSVTTFQGCSFTFNIYGTTTITFATLSGSITGPGLTPASSVAVPGTGTPNILVATTDGANWTLGRLSSVAHTVSVQRFTSGSGTYTPTTGTVEAEVTMCASGAGGSSYGGSSHGSAGANASFGTWTAVGGAYAASQVGGVGGTGGTTPGGGLVRLRVPGGNGQGAGNSNQSVGGNGGTSMLGGSGAGGGYADSAGVSGATNTGAGGGGQGGDPANGSGAGGGAGECVVFLVNNPTATSYVVPAGGAGATNAGSGAAGIVSVVERFAN